MKKFTYLLCFSLILPIVSNAQTLEERKNIATYSNKKANFELAKHLQNEDLERKIRLQNFIHQNPSFQVSNRIGAIGLEELLDVLPNGEKIFARTTNAGSATTARATALYNGGSLGISIQGQNMIAGVWDGGNARSTHQEFMVGSTSKITLGDGTDFQPHPTHVAGTIAAKGLFPDVRGVAFNSSILSYNWDSDLTEMLDQASNGLLVSNHSYGIGQLSSLWFYGAYDSRAQVIDDICYNNPYYLPVISAGNDRNKTTAPGSVQINTKEGFDMIFGHGNAKNIITVAAVNEVSPYIDTSSVVMSPFSSWGPSDDGRIKPDISMKGVNVLSTLSSSDTALGYMSGTSMASPGVTGVVLLLQQYYNQLYSSFMKSSTVKGLILHTADEAGFAVGPDYSFGWGLINAQKGAMAIRDKNSTTNNKSVIEEPTLFNTATYTKTITASGTNPLKISISWTDPAALITDINTGTVDPTTKYLINDLDIKVSKNGVNYYPWKLQGMNNTSGVATNSGTNDVDNFERVDINNPSGTYTITVTHKGTLSGGSQNFSLIATSDNLATLSTNEEIKANDTKVDFYPNPAKNYIQINEKDKDLLINIYDVSGKLILTSKLVDNKISISHLVKGNYIANFINKKGEIKSFKFIKE
ncbi:S8 family serine peptidase [Chryseobacterium wangxinyae]|uniref:S8 family serine peptidase n=1 Tax=Chryseobacterium sp. CY350 TaxID=2997336 RepID=UPI0022706AE7|nr:S8 family serine peptidase [Chryseobacterium sp. CY350]MCY0975808.1 S8 family serine peptidase [Chryseobacterium sp. CY350]WBZ94582.1 S8 family serine peptidase [Chryseobacterium sp. CY350]